MSDPISLAQLILQFIEFVWPFHRVDPWERGLIIFFGRWTVEVGPGTYPLLWYFMQMHPISMVPKTTTTATVETVTTKSGTMISYGLIYELQCVDARLAYLTVEDHEAKAGRDTWGIVADTLADLPKERLDPEEQRALRRTCLREANKRLADYGMKCNALTFATLATMRNYRMFTGA